MGKVESLCFLEKWKIVKVKKGKSRTVENGKSENLEKWKIWKGEYRKIVKVEKWEFGKVIDIFKKSGKLENNKSGKFGKC